MFGEDDSGESFGIGVYGTSDNGIGVYANSDTVTGSAILINGGIRVLSAGINTDTPVFIHQVATSNICTGSLNYGTTIDNPLINDRPNAILIVTPNNAGYSPPRGPVGVFYDSTGVQCGRGAGRWLIYDLSAEPTALVAGQLFNVLAVLP